MGDKSAKPKKDQLRAGNTTDQMVTRFDAQIKPIFIKNCSPCHFPGGKMYEKLPFDKDTTIVNHGTAILKRIKNEEENILLNNFLNQNKNGLRESKPNE